MTGVFCHFPTSAVAEVAGGAGEEGSVLGPVPGLLIARCRTQAAFETPNCRMLLSQYQQGIRAEFPDVGTLVGWSRSLVPAPRLLLSWCYTSLSAAPELGQIVPAEEHCRNLPAGVRCRGRRLHIPEMLSPACWRAGQQACGSGVKASKCLGAVSSPPVPGI